MVLVYNGKFYSASVGDSRAVLVTTKVPEQLPTNRADMRQETRDDLEKVLATHPIEREANVVAVQLTKD
jgi:serine/threonine protein phosphatase PrpC